MMAGGVTWIPALCGKDRPQYAFWDDALTLNTSTPGLTVCFQKTVLLWVPCGWLWACALLYYIYHLYKRPTRHTTWDFSWLNIIKLTTCLLLSFITMIGIGLLGNVPNTSRVDYMYGITRFVTMVLAAILVRWEYLKGVHSSGVSSVFWLLQFICDVIILRSWVLRQKVHVYERQEFVLFTVYFILVTVMFVSSLFSDKGALLYERPEHETIPLGGVENQNTNPRIRDECVTWKNNKTLPELYIPFWQKATFLWMISPIVRGYRKPATFDSLYDLRRSDKCCHLVPRFYTTFTKGQSDGPLPLRTKSGQRRPRTSLPRALFSAGAYIVIPGLLMFVLGNGLNCLQTLVFGELVRYTERGDPHMWRGVLLAVCLSVMGVLASIFIHYYWYFAIYAGMLVRRITCAVVYRKALRLSSAAKKTTQDGEIMNLMSVDAKKLEDFFMFGVLMWTVLVGITLCTVLLYAVIGLAALAGVLLLCVVVIVNTFYTARWIKRLQTKQMKYKDMRLKLTSELFSGIKIIKLYAWEVPFLQKVMTARSKELYHLKLVNIVGAVSDTIWFLVPYLMSVTIFATFVLISPMNILTPYTSFVVMSLINVINQLSSLLPIAISACAQAFVSAKRISSFLDLEEIEAESVVNDLSMKDAVSITDGTFNWDPDGGHILSNITLHVPKGHLVAVVGSVGSGKSSLLSAILGEMSKKRGAVKVNGSIAYVPQQAWIRNSSLQDNIVFGKKYVTTLFDSTIEAAALVQDLRVLPDGVRTEIGEKGVNLSGGQKQRISLARAVYQDEDIYLLDDPLSAVDAHVGKHIFEKVISNKGLLKDKTRILVTHCATFLPFVDTILIMRDGTILEMGTYVELSKKGENVAEFLQGGSNGPAVESQGYCGDGNLENERPAQTNDSKQSTIYNEPTSKRRVDNKPSKLIKEEQSELGNLGMAVIWRYVQAGGRGTFFIILLSMVALTAAQIVTSLWLQKWSADEININGTVDANRLHLRMGVYGALGLGQALFAGILLLACALGCLWASQTLHSDLLHQLVRAPMALFDCVPLGRILNRCSMDMDLIDSTMFKYLSRFFFALGPTVSTFIVISLATPVVIVPCVPVLIAFAIIQHVYIAYARQLRRIASIRCSPIYSHFDETLHGIPSIRAYGRQGEFIADCDKRIDDSQKAFYLILLAQRCLGVLLESLGNVVTFFAALFAVLYRDSLPRGMAALSVSYALNISFMSNTLIRIMTELETNMVSVERVDEYCHVDQEAEWSVSNAKTEEDWPKEGNITIDGYATRYRPGLDLVLTNINCVITGGLKVGVVGRTGAGKSSLALALVRIIEAVKGRITIDGMTIAHLGLHDLRSRLTVIPQEPVIFSGSLRCNLDPFSKHSEVQLWHALEKAHLKPYVEGLPEGLDYECGKGGNSLSTGQRQLVCLARAILRKTKVLILDEATAAVDLETDALIQKTLRDIFADCTVLAIAHRLGTVLDYDRIMVIDQGMAVEFDTPEHLLSKKDSIFHSLAKEAGLV